MRKKNDFKRRFYINYRKLNNAIIRDIYLLFNLQILRDNIEGIIIYIKLD